MRAAEASGQVVIAAIDALTAIQVCVALAVGLGVFALMKPGGGKTIWPALASLAAAGVAVGMVALVATFFFEDDEDRKATEIAPVEYLYLDNDRVVAYLAQLHGGLSKSERRSRTERESVNAGFKGGGGFEVGASAQRERFVEEVVTATAVSDFVNLRRELLSGGLLHIAGDAELQRVNMHEGDFLSIRTAELLYPAYWAPYLILRQSGTLRALFPRSGGDRRRAKGFARRVGPNPRLTFAVQARLGQRRFARYLMPMQYARLTDERSLLSGGALTIVAKVIRRFPQISRASGKVVYRDFATRETWRGPLQRAPASLIRRAIRTRKVIKRCRLPSVKEARHCLIKHLNEQTRIHRPGAILIPVAIYK